MSADEPTSRDGLLAEIEAEARRRRESGEVPPDLERDLDQLFESLVPDTAGERDFSSALERAERDALIDVHPPTESERAVLEPVKRGVKKLVLWYMDYVAGQVVALGGSLVRAVRLLGERVDDLEHRIDDLVSAHSALRAAALDPTASIDVSPAGSDPAAAWAEGIVAGVGEVPGRVLHTEARDATVLEKLRAAGVDAYAVGPGGGDGDAPDGVRAGSALSHLATVADAALGGLVVSGVVDRQSLAQQVELVRLAARVLAPGGRVVLVGTAPEAWAASVPVTEADLAPGRPLHAETWSVLLGSAGFSVDSVEHGAGENASFLLVATR